jgi:hypothetical protein
VSDCCLTPNEQSEELDISKNSGKPYKYNNFDKEDILRPSEELAFSVGRLLSITFHINI